MIAFVFGLTPFLSLYLRSLSHAPAAATVVQSLCAFSHCVPEIVARAG